MVLNSFLMILSGLLRGLDDFLTVYWECLMNNCGRSLLRAEWSRTAKKLTSWLFGILLVQIRIVGQGPYVSFAPKTASYLAETSNPLTEIPAQFFLKLAQEINPIILMLHLRLSSNKNELLEMKTRDLCFKTKLPKLIFGAGALFFKCLLMNHRFMAVYKMCLFLLHFVTFFLSQCERALRWISLRRSYFTGVLQLYLCPIERLVPYSAPSGTKVLVMVH